MPNSLSVRMKGLEPPRLSAPDPKSGTATNYATSAKGQQRYKKFLKLQKLILLKLFKFGFGLDTINPQNT